MSGSQMQAAQQSLGGLWKRVSGPVRSSRSRWGLGASPAKSRVMPVLLPLGSHTSGELACGSLVPLVTPERLVWTRGAQHRETSGWAVMFLQPCSARWLAGFV